MYRDCATTYRFFCYLCGRFYMNTKGKAQDFT